MADKCLKSTKMSSICARTCLNLTQPCIKALSPRQGGFHRGGADRVDKVNFNVLCKNFRIIFSDLKFSVLV